MTLFALTLCLAVLQVQEDLPPLGTNLAAFSDGSTQWPLVDAFKMARLWAAKTPGEPLEIDENGNVKSLKPGQVAETVIYTNGHHPLGKYTLLWTGSGEFETEGGSSIKIESPGKAILEVTEDRAIQLNLIKVDPEDPPRDIRLIMPGYEDTYKEEPFHPVFLQRMSLYRSLRFADWGATNDSKQRIWKDRATLEDATYTGPNGVPYEVMIDLANTKSSIPWFSIPHLADDEYVRSLAKLIKEKLNPGLRICVEYSNETWGFEQSKWCQDQGLKLKLSDGQQEAGQRYYSQRSVEIFAIFEEVFGGKSRLVRMLSTPMGSAKDADAVLSWKGGGRKADALAIAPYFGAGSQAGTLDDLFSKSKLEIAGPLRDQFFEYSSVAAKYRLKLVAFAGGQHLTSISNSTKLLEDANRDLRIADAYGSMLKNWRSSGGTLFMSYNDCSPWTPKNQWGVIEYQNQDPQTSYKNQALIQYALFPDR